MNNQEPTLVGGRYELGELLGRGGMAEVRKGTDKRLGRVVAVKRLRTDLASDATFQARFRREAQASASLNHPSIVSVYDTGEEMTDDGVAQPYIVMEYVAGRTLRDIIREGRKILPERALEITSGVLSALDYSHRAGIIHRDIKPGNVMLTPAGDVKVMDFGIARAMSDASSTMTQTAAVVGTAQYLSPEQARGETVDSRSDVYSTGCLLYELLTGRPPFVGDSPVAVAYQHVREPAEPPSQHDIDLPPEVDSIAMKALAKRVEDRYQSAAAMRTDIERYLSGRPVQAPAVVAPVLAPDPTPTALTQVVPQAAYDEEPARRTGLFIVLGLLALGLVAGGWWFLANGFEKEVEQVQVPSLVGKTDQQARALLGDLGLVPDPDVARNETVAEGKIFEQDPDRDTYVDPGSTISYTVSTGLPLVTVPPVVGQSRRAAGAQLEALGFVPDFVEVDSDEPRGQVIETNPASGTKVQKGASVQVSFSDGPEEIPDLVGMTQEEAEQAVRDAGFSPDVIQDANTTEPAGTVIRQSPAAEQTAPQGSTVTIVVSSFVEPSPPPSESPSPSDGTLPPDEPLPPDTP